MKKKIKLLFVVLGLNKEAISFLLVNRINQLIKTGNYEIFVISEYNNNEDLIRELNKSVTVITLNISNLLLKKQIPIIGYFYLKQKIKKLYQEKFDEINPNIIIGINLESFYKELIPFVRTNAKKIIEFHGTFKLSESKSRKRKSTNLKSKIHPSNLFRIPETKLHNLYDLATVLTKENLQDRSYLKIPVTQIYNPAPFVNKIQNFSERENQIIAVGRIVPDKNFIDLVEAINLIKDQIKNWKVHIYGTKFNSEPIQLKINEYSLEDQIVLKGFSNDMPSVYNNSKILVSTSLNEGLPMNLIEALTYKVPVIAYNCKCGPKEIIKDRVNGYLIDFSVEQLAEKILELTSNPEKLQEFSNHCHDDIDRFDFEKIMKQWDEFYQSIAQLEKS